MNYSESLRKRAQIELGAANDPTKQAAALELCARGVEGCIFFIENFCWTFDPRENPQDLPFTHTVIPHSKLVEATLEALSYRSIEVVKDEYGISKDGMKMFGALTLNLGEDSDRPDRVNLVLALRNSHDKSFSLGMVAGFRVFVCDNLAFRGEFFALARKHSKRLMEGFTDAVAIGVDRCQRHFVPMQEQVNVWRNHELADIQAREIIYRAFIEDAVDAPKHLAKHVHSQYFQAEGEPAFTPATLWRLQNSFTCVFKEHLEPLPLYRATASLGEFFDTLN